MSECMNMTMRTAIWIATLVCLPSGLQAQYALTVDSMASAVPDQTTYRFLVNMPGEEDRMSAVFGAGDYPMLVQAPEGVYNSALNSTWNASGLNPAFVAVYPELASDTYATIGLAGPAATSGLEGAADPSIVEDVSQPISPFFLLDGETTLEASTLVGSSWYILNTASNGLPDANGQVLIMQVTTSGSLAGVINYQVFPNGDGDNDQIVTMEFDGVGTFGLPEVLGCTDSLACNFDVDANVDDGSCAYDADGDGICDDQDDCIDAEAPFWTYFPPDDTIACDEMMPTIFETMPAAEDSCSQVLVEWVSDGPFGYPFGCLQSYTCPRIYRATDEAGNVLLDTLIITVLDTIGPAIVYPSEAFVDVNEVAGEVVPVLESFVLDNCDANVQHTLIEEEVSNDGVTQVLTRTVDAIDACGNESHFVQTLTVHLAIEGCMDEAACNFNALANVEDGSCEFAAPAYDCEGVCLVDVNGNGICDPLEVVGCTDASACNYNPEANVDDGLCEYCSCAESINDGYGVRLEVVAEHDAGALQGQTTYRLYVTTPHDDDVLSSVYGDDESPLSISSSEAFFQDPLSGALGTSVNPLFFPSFPDLEFDSWLTIGLVGAAGAGEIGPLTIGDDTNGWISDFEMGNAVSISDSPGGALFIPNATDATNAASGATQQILIGQFTTAGQMSGMVNVQAFNHGNPEDESLVTLMFEGVGWFSGATLCGCFDSEACNYVAEAVYETDDCTYQAEPYLDCDGACLNDSDGDGVCNEIEFAGCMDPEGCNYDPIYTDPGFCNYPELGFDCFGNCILDLNENGICDPNEVLGCMDPEDCNYNSAANVDDGSCGDSNVANDFCPGAVSLYCGQVVTGNNEECASVDEVGGCAVYDPVNPTAGLWYSFYGIGEMVTVTTCLPGTEIDTYLSVFEGSCQNPTCVAGNDDQSEPVYNDLCPVFAFASTLEFFAEAGVTYRILVLGVSGEEGDFQLTVVCPIEGCLDPEACNYDPEASIDAGNCEYDGPIYDCEGNCWQDSDGDGVCDPLEVEGCTDVVASNYNPLATDDDGSCSYCNLFTVEVMVQDTLVCEGDSTASMWIDLLGLPPGESPTIDVNGVAQDSVWIGGLTAGSYVVTVQAGGDCEVVEVVVIQPGQTPEFSLMVTDALCSGDSSGTIEFVADGGALTNIQIWNDNWFVATSDLIVDSLMAGTYNAEVMDSLGCQAWVEGIVIDEPTPLNLQATTSDALDASGGSIELEVAGGTSPYVFAWVNESGEWVSEDQNLEGVEAPQAYSVVVTDDNGCMASGGPYIIDDVFAVGEVHAFEADIFPNPAREVLWVSIPGGHEVKGYKVVDAKGAVVHSARPMNPDLFSIDVQAWGAGAYVLEVETSVGIRRWTWLLQP